MAQSCWHIKLTTTLCMYVKQECCSEGAQNDMAQFTSICLSFSRIQFSQFFHEPLEEPIFMAEFRLVRFISICPYRAKISMQMLRLLSTPFGNQSPAGCGAKPHHSSGSTLPGCTLSLRLTQSALQKVAPTQPPHWEEFLTLYFVSTQKPQKTSPQDHLCLSLGFTEVMETWRG